MLQANEAYDSFKDNIMRIRHIRHSHHGPEGGPDRVDVIAVDQVLGEYTNKNLGGEMKECSY